MAFAYFPDDQIEKLYEAATSAGFANGPGRLALLGGVNLHFVGLMPLLPQPALQQLSDIRKLNDTERLSDGTVPLQTWLRNAVLLSTPLPAENAVFRRALEDVSAETSMARRIVAPQMPPEVKEAVIQQDDMVPYSFLLGGDRAGVSVVRLCVPRFVDGKPGLISSGEQAWYAGSGWLLTGDLVMTNSHVVHFREGFPDKRASDADLALQVKGTKVEFDYDGEGHVGMTLVGAELVAGDVKLDYAVLRLAKPVAKRDPLPLDRRQVAMPRKGYLPVNIIQHAGGGPKRVALRNNLVYQADYPDLWYFTDTDHGSSGSPVFDDAWRVVALHRGTKLVDDVTFNGRSTGLVNVGTQIAAVLEHLAAHHPGLMPDPD